MNKKISIAALLLQVFLVVNVYAVLDPLPSWNEGDVKQAIINYVQNATTEGSDAFIPVKDRIATFDEDGTLWVEQPVYTEFFYTMDAIRALSSKHPEWTTTEPYKTILSGNIEAIKNLNKADISLLIAKTHSGMSVEEFQTNVKNWLKKSVHPRFKKPFTELVYQPMLELIHYFRSHQFDIYIVSGGSQDFIRAFAEELYGIPPNHVVGTASKVKYEYRDGHPALVKLPEILFIDDKEGKPEGINLIIGKTPVAAFGNSIGDQQMLEWTQGNNVKTFELLVHHDDAEREYAYGPESKIGTFSEALLKEAERQKWLVVSMKNDWKVIFLWQSVNEQNIIAPAIPENHFK